MASMSTENASSSFSPSSSITPGWRYEYDVFISFRGSDTRNKFTSHLSAALERSGFTTFRDDENLERGAIIAPALLRAIEGSRFAVVIFSSNYASSSWCLTELAKIVECMNKEKLTVLPVFYDVDPSDVRKLRGTFEEDFAKHLEYNSGNIQKWKDAVTQVAGIAGWDLRDQPESSVIQKIVQRISVELNRTLSSVSNHLVGMDARVKEMLDLYFSEALVRFVGICGMGGLGKTLAREIYKRISGDFEASGFIITKTESSENLASFSLSETACAIERKLDEGEGPNGLSLDLKLGEGMKLEEGEGPNGLSLELKLGLFDPWEKRPKMKLEEGEGPNGLSLELKLGLFDPWVIKKQIVFSDINNGKSRLLLPKNLVKKHILPQWDERCIKNNSVQVSVWDFDTESEHQLLFKQWPSSGSYVLVGNWIMEFVCRRGLKEADEIGLYWDRSSSRFSFSLLKQASSN